MAAAASSGGAESGFPALKRAHTQSPGTPQDRPAWLEEFQQGLIAAVGQSIRTEVQRLEERLFPMESQLKDHEKRLQSLERAASPERGSVASAPAGAAWPSSSSLPSSAGSSPWTASFLRIRNFCEIAEAREKGIKREDAELLVASLQERLPASLKGHVLPLRLRFARNAEIQVPVKGGVVSEVLDYWNAALREDSTLEYGPAEGPKRRLYVVPERSPEDKPRYAAMGRMRKALEVLAQKRHVVWRFAYSYSPQFRIFLISDNGDKHPIVKQLKNGTFEYEAGIEDALGVTEAVLKEEYAQAP